MEYKKVNVNSQIISTDCRKIHGDKIASEIAIESIRKNLIESLNGWPKNKDAKFEISFTLHRPIG